MDRPRPCRSTPAGASSATASARGGLITLWMPDGIRVLRTTHRAFCARERRYLRTWHFLRLMLRMLAMPWSARELAGHTRRLIVVGP